MWGRGQPARRNLSPTQTSFVRLAHVQTRDAGSQASDGERFGETHWLVSSCLGLIVFDDLNSKLSVG